MRARAVVVALVVACSSNHAAPKDAGDDGGHGDDGGSPITVSGITPTFTFESGPVRPLALSPDGARLYAANTANGSLDTFAVGSDGALGFVGSTYVGVDPVAVATHGSGEVWVVNQVSDSVSVVDVTTTPPHVSRTLLVGDAPSDIVFAGSGGDRAFITTAHRGQQRSDPSVEDVPGAGDPQLTTPGISRADVWVFDATNLGLTVGGTPVAIVTLFGDTPRALAVTPDGKTVYAAVFKSGNQTTATSSALPCPGFDSAGSSSPCTSTGGIALPGAAPGPGSNYAGIGAPAVAMILQQDDTNTWHDLFGRDWTAATTFTLPDQDVFAIDATALTTTATFQHVGTTLFGMAVNPASGNVYVANTQARTDLRFEGPGTFAGTTLQGHLAEADVTVIAGTTVTPRHLNKHIDYTQLPAPAGTADHSLSMPVSVAVSGDGATVFIAAFGSSKIGVLPAAALENDTFDPVTASSGYIPVTGGGPSGIVVDAARGKLYVATRFDDGISVVDIAGAVETSHVTLTDPEPAKVVAGRKFLYDATVSSSNGEAACASCHMFGDKDDLVWDLGNPDGDPVDTPITIKLSFAAPPTINGTGVASSLHPMKGPMTTQTLRGLANHGPMHWRGDRVSGFFGTDANTMPPYDSRLAFKNFILAFQSLCGLGTMFPSADMDTFADFALAIQMPPNPVRALDNSLNASQTNGRKFFLGCVGLDSFTGLPVSCDASGNVTGGHVGHFADGLPQAMRGERCVDCHVLDPANGFFGTDGESSFENLPQVAKIPQLRNLYDKIGMFGMPAVSNINPLDNGPQGPQVRGTGFEHDGSVDTIFRFLQAIVFNPSANGLTGWTDGDAQRRDVEQYLLAFDSDLAPIVGQQVTLRVDNSAAVGPRIDLFVTRATTPYVSKLTGGAANECDLVARVARGGAAVTYRMQSDKSFAPDDGSARLSDAALRALAATPGQEVTYTCLPPGWAGGD